MIWSYNKGYYYKFHCLCLTLPHSEVSIYPDFDLNNNETAKDEIPRIYQFHNNITFNWSYFVLISMCKVNLLLCKKNNNVNYPWRF